MTTKSQLRSAKRLKNRNKQKQTFPQILKEVIKSSDLIIQILDARFISDTRNLEIEKEIKKQNKKIIYVLNKEDLLTKQGKEKAILELQLKKLFPNFFISCKNRKGISKLRNKIKQETKKINISRERIQVGIIGYPNTGKSSLINLLIGKSSAKTSAQAGFTKGIQKIRLTSDILILDTPGLIPGKKYSNSSERLIPQQVVVGARTIDTIKEPGLVVHELMKKYSNEINKYYDLNIKGNSEDLILELGKIKGFLKKGGFVDENRTCNLIIKDWQKGNIKI